MEAFAVISFDHQEQKTYVDYVVAENGDEAEKRVADVRGEYAWIVDCLSLECVESIRRTLLGDHQTIEADWQRVA